MQPEFAEMSRQRRMEIENYQKYNDYRNRIKDIAVADSCEPELLLREEESDSELPF